MYNSSLKYVYQIENKIEVQGHKITKIFSFKRLTFYWFQFCVSNTPINLLVFFGGGIIEKIYKYATFFFLSEKKKGEIKEK
jgi:hypothetical protein